MSPTSDLRFGLCTPERLWSQDFERQHELVAQVADLGFHHIYMADHVSFRDGSGTDGFVEVAALSRMHPTLGVMISVYLLPLRHPMPVARQLATMHKLAPGRMMFGVGIGGDDRHEVEVCGVNPRTRGRLANESLSILRALMQGVEVTSDGEFFPLQAAQIKPRIDPPIPILIGGRSDGALKRTAMHGDGWMGIWCSPRRYGEAISFIEATAIERKRESANWMHGYQPWVGVADTKAQARDLVSKSMEAFYKVPFEKFERYIPYGTPDEVAADLKPYLEQGCRVMNLKVVAASDEDELAGAGEIRERLV